MIRYIKSQDLIPGDEIIISNYSALRYCQVIRVSQASVSVVYAKIPYPIPAELEFDNLYPFYVMTEKGGEYLMNPENMKLKGRIHHDSKHIILVKRRQQEGWL